MKNQKVITSLVVVIVGLSAAVYFMGGGYAFRGDGTPPSAQTRPTEAQTKSLQDAANFEKLYAREKEQHNFYKLCGLAMRIATAYRDSGPIGSVSQREWTDTAKVECAK